MAIYNHDGASEEENDRFLKTIFNRNAEQAWDEKGTKLEGIKVLTKKESIKFAQEILSNWKKLSPEENESYI